MSDAPFDDPGMEEDLILADLVSRVLDRGAVISGDVVITVAGIDLVELGLNLYLTSSEKARNAGMRPVGPLVSGATGPAGPAVEAERPPREEPPASPRESADDGTGAE